jgi:hypothetical protein
MSTHIFGIRHHGPGSARSLVDALESLRPDCLLIEGPPDAHQVLPLALHAEIQPPIALLIYHAEHAHLAVYYPFAVFSPEWQAIRYGLANQIAVRFIDLPQAHQLIPEAPKAETTEAAPSDPPAQPPEGERSDPNNQNPNPDAQPASPAETIRNDPLSWLAEAAGYSDGERWWEHIVEQRRDSRDVFAAILEAMGALREKIDGGRPDDEREARREAYMRQSIRAAQAEGFERIAVVCGAWHGPALVDLADARADEALLKGLPKAKVHATWVPWTHGRLSYRSGYGAGIESPGWYHHLWTTEANVAVHWLARVAQLLRGEDLDASPAHVIEAVRLAEALAALRDRPLPGLPELSEATRAILCFGDDAPMRLIHQKLIVGEILGEVPDDTPMVPLQRDLAREQKRLRLKPEASKNTLALDLRKPLDLDRSRLLHRLNLIKVQWGKNESVGRRKKGTFHENWTLQWQPEFAVNLIEAGIWGNSLPDAAAGYARHLADSAPDLPALTELVERALLADLPEAIAYLMTRLQAEAALAADVGHLMAALPPLAAVMRYGSVRQADTSMVAGVVDGLVARVCIGLPGACASLNDDAAAAMFANLVSVHGAIGLLENDAHTRDWQAVLARLAGQQGLHGLVAGRCVRLLLDAEALSHEEAARRMSLALSAAGEPTHAAAWIEGFLKGSGLLLLHDEGLWRVLDEWVTLLKGETFVQLLPLLRRTFSTFHTAERRQMGEKVKGLAGRSRGPAASYDDVRGDAVLPLLAQMLGLEGDPPNTEQAP